MPPILQAYVSSCLQCRDLNFKEPVRFCIEFIYKGSRIIQRYKEIMLNLQRAC